MSPEYWNAATQHLRRTCPVMKQLIAQYRGESLKARGDGFYTLLRSVVGQQISVKAADAVWAKLEAAVRPLTPHALLDLPDESLRACGLSAQKVAYARNVAMFFVERGIEQTRGGYGVPSDTPHRIAPCYWANLTDDEVIAQLTAIQGIGTWTAEMFLIFHLLRPDVFPVKDLGVLKAMHLHMPNMPTQADGKWLKPKEYMAIAERWAPYRTVATWYLWRSLDPVPVAY